MPPTLFRHPWSPPTYAPTCPQYATPLLHPRRPLASLHDEKPWASPLMFGLMARSGLLYKHPKQLAGGAVPWCRLDCFFNEPNERDNTKILTPIDVSVNAAA